MGKGKNKRRLQQRLKAVGEEVEASIRQDGQDRKLQHVDAQELFHVDSKGGAAPTLTKKQKLEQLQKDPLLKSHKYVSSKASKAEEERVKQLKAAQEKHAGEQAKQAAKLAAAAKKPLAGLWGADGNAKGPAEAEGLDEYVAPAVVKKVKRRKLVPSTKHKVSSVEVAAAGQSYHPDFETHQDVMAEAVSKELERQEMNAKQREPLRKGLSEETLQYIKTGSDSDESEEEEETESVGKKRKLPEKVTRSQRNKRSRHKQMEMEHKARRGEKSLLKQINAANHILNDVIKSEKNSEKKQQLKKLQEQQKLQQEPLVRVGGKYLKLDRDTPVSFSEELTGNMRTLKPKGHPLLERFDSLHKRNQIDIGRPRKTRKAKVRVIEVKK